MRHQILRSSLTAIACLIPTITFAQIPQAQIDPTMFMVEKDLVKEETKRKLQASEDYQDLLQNSIEFVDINNDNYVSDREFSNFINGFDISSQLPQTAQQKHGTPDDAHTRTHGSRMRRHAQNGKIRHETG